ncbi:hypothetical protein [Marinicella sp. W31]|uniref:hypothetical protein n=1 Tax=Marinicella sp. W31 TaxID=3023713 RepID=UPI0037576F33
MDAIEEEISNPNQAAALLEQRLPDDHMGLDIWDAWISALVAPSRVLEKVKQAMRVAFARMAFRNGILSAQPRPYHNEGHINDLLERLILCSRHSSSESVPEYGWMLLSFFAATHDLRQAEDNTPLENTLVGRNESASYDEAIRIIDMVDPEQKFRQKYRDILQLMIYGSTFSHGQGAGLVFEGNLALPLLAEVNDITAVDRELVLLACDIDTANVSLSITQYAQSAIKVFRELQSHHNPEYPAQAFFSKQQYRYFLELQKFHSVIGKSVFEPMKQHNTDAIQKLSNAISELPAETSQEDVIVAFSTTAQQLDHG